MVVNRVPSTLFTTDFKRFYTSAGAVPFAKEYQAAGLSPTPQYWIYATWTNPDGSAGRGLMLADANNHSVIDSNVYQNLTGHGVVFRSQSPLLIYAYPSAKFTVAPPAKSKMWYVVADALGRTIFQTQNKSVAVSRVDIYGGSIAESIGPWPGVPTSLPVTPAAKVFPSAKVPRPRVRVP